MGLIGKSAVMQRLFLLVQSAAASDAPARPRGHVQKRLKLPKKVLQTCPSCGGPKL